MARCRDSESIGSQEAAAQIGYCIALKDILSRKGSCRLHRTAIRVLNKFRKLKEKPYWGNHFWSRGYCVDTVGLDTEVITKYIRYQEITPLTNELSMAGV